jgi:CheY-like chemotaxis protein
MAVARKKILLLEDDSESMQPLREYLESKGWLVELTASSGILERLPKERFDLLLVDLMIYPEYLTADNHTTQNIQYPGVAWQQTGLEFVRRMRAGEYSGRGGQGTLPAVPIVVLSAMANETVGEEGEVPPQVDAYVEKPFRLSNLSKTIEQLLGRV